MLGLLEGSDCNIEIIMLRAEEEIPEDSGKE